MHETHCAGRELVARGLHTELVEFAIDSHETDVIIALRALFESSRNFTKALPRLDARPPRRTACATALHGAPDFKETELAVDVDLGNDDSSTRQDHDQTLPRQPLWRLPDRRAPDAELFGELSFGDRAPRPKPQSHDHLFEIEIRL